MRHAESMAAVLAALTLAACATNDGARPARAEHARGCTIFSTFLEGDPVLVGNLDHPNPGSAITFLPASEEGFGAVMLGYDARSGDRDWVGNEVGMNDQGLAFGTNGLPDAPMTPHPERDRVMSGVRLWRQALRTCASVEQLLELVEGYDFGDMMDFQIHAIDAEGAAVVIGPGPDGELLFTRRPEESAFLVSTNFNRGNPQHHHDPYPCPRYQAATRILGEAAEPERIDLVRCLSALETAHFEGPSYNTILSYVFDVKRRAFMVFLFHDYDEALELELAVELEKGARELRLETLFSEATRAAVAAERAAYAQED